MAFVFLFLTYFAQYEDLQVRPGCFKWHYFILFRAEQCSVVCVSLCVCCMCVSQLFYPLICSLGFPHSSVGKESSCNAGDLGSIPGLGRVHGEGNGYYYCILAWTIPMDRAAWWATVHGVTKSWTRPSRFHFHFFFYKKILFSSLPKTFAVFLQ